MSALEDFRAETRDWLDEYCLPGARAGGGGNRGKSGRFDSLYEVAEEYAFVLWALSER